MRTINNQQMKKSRVEMLKERYRDEYMRYGGQYIAINEEGRVVVSGVSYGELSRSFDGKDRPYYIFPVVGPNGERPEGITISRD